MTDREDRARETDPLGVYVHWPFCLSKCPYCDFNSHVARDTVDQGRWAKALIAELTHYAEATPGRPVASIFFGGGTPSLMAAETVAAVIDAIRRLWPAAADQEVSLEANPSSVETATFPALRDAGVNRLSIGVQALDDADLKALGRYHNAREALAALALARATFERFSFDLIYARPGQTLAGWRDELARALDLAGPHLSFYQLTIEPGTPFHKDGVAAAGPDEGADLFDATQEMLAASGLPAYEISNHARPGFECRHNLNIWRGHDYVGVGPGAHGRLTLDGRDFGTHQIHNPGRWLETVERRGDGTAKRRPLKARDRAVERIMMGLRLAEGIDRGRFRRLAGADVLDFIDPGALARARDEGYAAVDDQHLAATAEGRLRLNGLLKALLVS